MYFKRHKCQYDSFIFWKKKYRGLDPDGATPDIILFLVPLDFELRTFEEATIRLLINAL